jgi:GNAT superfamily N-acetyltransferase
MAITYATELRSVEGYQALLRSTGSDPDCRLTGEDLAAALAKSWHLETAYDGERLVGFGRIVSDGVLHAMIYDVVTDSGHWDQGVGAEILRRLVARCREAGIRDIQLFCAEGARTFYEKGGFRPRPADAPGMEYAGADPPARFRGTPFLSIASFGMFAFPPGAR